MAQVKIPPATFEQVEASAKATEFHGRVYVSETRSTQTSRVRDVSLTVDVWPEGYEAGLRGRINWTLWGDQCDTKGEEIKEIYHEHSGLVIVRGIHKGKSYTDKNGMEVEKIEATSFDFSKFGAGLTPPDYALLRDRCDQLEATVASQQELIQNHQAWLDWIQQFVPALQSLQLPAAEAI